MIRVAKSPNGIEGLAARMAAFEEQAYLEFADTFGPRLRAFFAKRGLIGADAEDLAVSCITDMALKIDKYHSQARGTFEGWVFTVARNYMIDWLRTRNVSEPLPETVAVAPAFDSEEEVDLDVAEAVTEALASLSADDQSIIKLRYFGGENDFGQIAAELGITREAARVRHSRAIRKLKGILESDERIRHRTSRR